MKKIKTKTMAVVSGAVLSSLAIAAAALMPLAASAATPVVYNNIPTPQPGNLPSEAFEATSTSEFGGQVAFDGTARQNPKVTVLMSSWGCESGSWDKNNCVTTSGSTFTEDITLNIYSVDAANAPDTKIATVTKTFNIPYRPSADTRCIGTDAGKWSDGHTCFNGFATPISFDTTGITLPNKAIVSVAYNTTHYGAQPQSESKECFTSDGGCGYDSLNVGLNASPTIGSDPQPDATYINSVANFNETYCDAGSTNVFRETGPCWTGFQPAIKVEASEAAKQAETCKNNGWKTLRDTNNHGFKNQGDCVSFFATGGKNLGNGQ